MLVADAIGEIRAALIKSSLMAGSDEEVKALATK